MKSHRMSATALLVALACGTAMAGEIAVPDEVRARLEPILTKSGGELTFFDGPSDMIGVGISLPNAKQIVVYATPDGRTVFSGVAVDVETGANLSSADMQNLPAPNYSKLFDTVAQATHGVDGAASGPLLYAMSEGNPDAANEYYVFVDPKCPYCHATYNSFLTALSQGHDMVVHYIPIGILGPESENLAKQMAGSTPDAALDILRTLVRKEPYLTQSSAVQQGTAPAGLNLQLFRNLSFDAVPVIVSRVGGKYNVRQGAVEAPVIVQELQVAALAQLNAAGQ